MKEITSKRTKQTQFITDEEWDWLKEHGKAKNFTMKEMGPLNNPNTNQRFYEVRMSREIDENGNPIYGLTDITDIFWK